MPSISVFHNSMFSYKDIESVLEPIFGDYYGIEQLRSLISSVDHIWCVYDTNRNRHIACALVQSHDHKNLLYIKLFGVEKSSQGQGMGTRLLKAIKKWAEKQQYFAILLHTQIDNNSAIGLYEKVGFIKQYYFRKFFHSNQSPILTEFYQPDAYQMILYL